MGRPYRDELRQLAETYAWASNENIESIARACFISSEFPVVSVGSGGSLSVAHLLSQLHANAFSKISRAVTPYELLQVLPMDKKVAIWLLTAGGRNIDIQRAFTHSVLYEPRQLVTLCLQGNSPLAAKGNRYQWTDLFDLNAPFPRDGFLATNSLLALSVLLVRAFESASGRNPSLPKTLESLLQISLGDKTALASLQSSCQCLWERDTLIVLYSNEVKATAIDIESKFVEAALGNVQISDFRNFAHGRHHWLAKRTNDSSVIAISTPYDYEIANSTLKLLPSTIPKVFVKLKAKGNSAKIAGLVIASHIAGWSGKAKGIDPGKPGVPEFGRKIYNLRTPSGLIGRKSKTNAAIERKLATMSISNPPKKLLRDIEFKYDHCKRKFAKAAFKAIVLDYDGTLIDVRKRGTPPAAELINEITRLIKGDLIIGIATGRGSSVKEELRSVLPQKLWNSVFVGYYNCALIGGLADDTIPSNHVGNASNLVSSLELKKKLPNLSKLAKVKTGPYQITIIPRAINSLDATWDTIQQTLLVMGRHDLALVRSGHSIDIVPQGTSKGAMINYLTGIANVTPENILTIGDRGRWPGNDFALLDHLYSLSVDEVSSDLSKCWNFSPPGTRGPQATLSYLRKLTLVTHNSQRVARFKGL